MKANKQVLEQNMNPLSCSLINLRQIKQNTLGKGIVVAYNDSSSINEEERNL